MGNNPKILVCALALLTLGLAADNARAAAGRFQFVSGDVRVVNPAGVERPAKKGDAVEEGDTVATGGLASAQLLMSDNGLIALRPDSRLRVDSYVYPGKEDGSEKGFLSLLRGGFRTITGVIGRSNKQNYLVRTPTATIGIRGTDHEPVFIPVPAPGQIPLGNPGTYDKVNVGAAYIQTPQGSVNIAPNQVGFAAPNVAPVLLPRIPDFYKATPAVQPAAARQAQAEERPAMAETRPAQHEEARPVRETAAADAPATAPPPPPTPVPAPATAQTQIPITTVDSAGSTINLTAQTITSSTGQTTSLANPLTNPASAPANRFGHGVLATRAVAGGAERTDFGNLLPATHLNYLLNNAGQLVEVAHTAYVSKSYNYQPVPGSIQDAKLVFSDGVGKDAFKAADGSAMIGRWEGGRITVTDLVATGALAPFAVELGPRSAHWVLASMPGSPYSGAFGPVEYPQTLIGSTNYSLLGATHPTDSAGNVGILNTAALIADFTRQNVNLNLGMNFSILDSAHPSTRNLAISGAGSGPIRFGGYQGTISATCSGADCAAANYGGFFRGNFAGAQAATTALRYGLDPFIAAPAAQQPFTDSIQGSVVLTGRVPAQGSVNPASGTAGLFRHEAIHAVNGDAATPGFALPAPNSALIAVSRNGADVVTSNNYLFDSNGNLIRLQSTPYAESDHATSMFSLANTRTSFAGGVAAEHYFDAAAGIRMGRWQGGEVVVEDLTAESALVNPLGNRSAAWVVAERPVAMPVSGVYHYTRTLGTAPTDSYGNVGTLEGARLAVDFGAMQVYPGVRVSINSGAGGALGSQEIRASASGIPIGPAYSGESPASGFNVSSADTNPLLIGCYGPGCAPGTSYGGRIRGGFSGDAVQGAYFRYTFNTLYPDAATATSFGRVRDDYISGLVAFNRGPEILPPGPAGANIATTYFSGTFNVNDAFYANQFETSPVTATPPGFTLDGAGNLLSARDAPFSDPHQETLAGGIARDFGQAGNFAATGITFGRWEGQKADGSGPALLISGNDSQGNFSNRAVLGSYHWVKGPESFPVYLSAVLSGTATYSLDGHTPPTNQNNVTGSVNSASLAVNFDRQAVNLGINLSIPAGCGGICAWSATATNVKLQDFSGGFDAGSSTFPALHNTVGVTLNGAPAFGRVQGELTGVGLSGAGVTYAFGGNSPVSGHEHVNGALAFKGPAQDTLAPYRIGIGVMGSTSLGSVLSAYHLSETDHNHFVTIEAHPLNGPNNVALNSSGLPVAFNGSLPAFITPGFAAPCPSIPCVSYTENPVRFSIVSGGATAALAPDSGKDPATGITWGRYTGGMIAVTDRINGSPLSPLNVANQSLHVVLSSGQAGPTVLPISGAATYTLVGNTLPTDNLGHAGTLTSATLNANFTAKIVDAAVNVAINGNNWAATAVGLPIIKGIAFEAEKKFGASSSPLGVTVNGSPSGTAGTLSGVFTGPAGGGAMLGYSLNQGGAAGASVSGVAAFRR